MYTGNVEDVKQESSRILFIKKNLSNVRVFDIYNVEFVGTISKLYNEFYPIEFDEIDI